ncbi:MAG: hypothetical protein KDD22_05235 [Bdellovibrionales bacterium]|nr:hypothetical protein [Bdellovibrionales bacterium]
MKRIFIALGLILILALIWKLRSPIKTEDVPRVSSNTSTKSIPNNKKLSEIVADSTQPSSSEALGSTPEATIQKSRECLETEARVSSLTSEQILQELREGRLQFKSECIEDFSPNSKVFLEMVVKACQKDMLEKEPGPCSKVVFLYKAVAMFEGLKQKNISSLTSEELVQGFFASMDDPKTQSEIARELSQRMPDSPFVAKAQLFAEMNEAGTTGSQQKIVESLDRNLDRSLELNPDDKDLRTLDMLVAIDKKETGLQNRLSNYIKGHPSDGIGHYGMAILAWKKKNKSLALQYMDQAVQREPENSTYRDVRKNMSQRTPPETISQFSINFNFTDL